MASPAVAMTTKLTPIELPGDPESVFLQIFDALSGIRSRMSGRTQAYRNATILMGRMKIDCVPNGPRRQEMIWAIFDANQRTCGKKLSYEGRATAEGRKWRSIVLDRDRHRCQECGSTSRLHAHHIKQWALYPELRYDPSNGITLCAACHSRKHPGMAAMRGGA